MWVLILTKILTIVSTNRYVRGTYAIRLITVCVINVIRRLLNYKSNKQDLRCRNLKIKTSRPRVFLTRNSIRYSLYCAFSPFHSSQNLHIIIQSNETLFLRFWHPKCRKARWKTFQEKDFTAKLRTLFIYFALGIRKEGLMRLSHHLNTAASIGIS